MKKIFLKSVLLFTILVFINKSEAMFSPLLHAVISNSQQGITKQMNYESEQTQMVIMGSFIFSVSFVSVLWAYLRRSYYPNANLIPQI